MRKRLTTRLITLSIFWIILTLLATVLLITWLYQDHIEHHYDAHVFTHVEELIAAVSVGPDGQPQLVREPTDPRFYREGSGWYWQVQPFGKQDGPALVSESLATGKLPVPSKSGVEPVTPMLASRRLRRKQVRR